MSLLCSIPLAASLFSACAAPAPLAVGYVEGDYVLLAPIEVAKVQSISVKRGDRVEAGSIVAEMEADDARIAVAEAEAALAQAQAQLADLKLGRRPEEIAVLDAMVRSANAEAEEKRRVFARATNLLDRGIATEAEFDEAQTAVEVAVARSTRRRPISPSPGCRRVRRRSRRRRAGSSRPAQHSIRRNGGCRSVRLRRRQPAASTTSSAIPATSPGRPRRSSRCCRTAR